MYTLLKTGLLLFFRESDLPTGTVSEAHLSELFEEFIQKLTAYSSDDRRSIIERLRCMNFTHKQLRLRERRWYGTMLFWLFSVANALALIVNVSDGVYYHYAKKRFTSDELSYLGNNDNTGTVLLKALAENWYVALFAAALVVLRVKHSNPILVMICCGAVSLIAKFIAG